MLCGTTTDILDGVTKGDYQLIYFIPEAVLEPQKMA